jgi:hypothetical protein
MAEREEVRGPNVANNYAVRLRCPYGDEDGLRGLNDVDIRKRREYVCAASDLTVNGASFHCGGSE